MILNLLKISVLTALFSANVIGLPVIEVTGETAFQELLEKSVEKPVIIDCFAQWCQPCKVLRPIFQSFADEQSNSYICASVDIDKLSMTQYDIKVLPTILVIKNKKVVGKMEGLTTKQRLTEKISEIFNGPRHLSKLPKEQLEKRLYDAIARESSLEGVQRLINAGVNINCRFKEGLTPLIVALATLGTHREKGLNIIKLLVKSGCIVNQEIEYAPGQKVSALLIIKQMCEQFTQFLEIYKKATTIIEEQSARIGSKL